MELEPSDAVLGDQPAGALDRVGTRRVDARERDQHVGVRCGGLGDLLVRDRRDPAARLPVDGEDDGRHAPLAVVRRDVVDRRQRLVAAEVPRRRRAQLGRHRVVPGARALGVHVHVDRGDRGEVDHGATVPSSSCRDAPAARRSQSGSGATDQRDAHRQPAPAPDARRERDDREAGPVPVVRQREVIEVAEGFLIAAAAERRDDRERGLDDCVDPVLREPIAPGGRVFRATVLASDVLLGGHRPLLGVLESGAIREAVSIAPVVETAVVHEHLREHEIEELGEHVEPGLRRRRLDPFGRQGGERALEPVGDVRVEIGDPR